MSADILELGKSGLFTAKKSMQTAGHNIANVNTEGFSRQRAVQETNHPIGTGGLVYGMGSQIRNIERMHSYHLEKQINSTISNHQYNTGRSAQLSELEGIFNEASIEGISQSLTGLFNSFRELSNNPESETVRSLVRENAKIFIRNVKRAGSEIKDQVTRMDRQLEEAVYDINSTLHELSRLNIKIKEVESVSGESGDLRDQRDLFIRNLSEYFSVDTYMDNQGKFNVSAKGIGTLVTEGAIQELKLGTQVGEKLFPGSREIYIQSNSNEPITHKFSQGTFHGLFETRQTELKLMQDKIDNLVWDTAQAVNAIHRKGFVNKKSPLDPEGKPVNLESFTNINFFQLPLEKARASEYIDLSSEIKKDLSNIVSALHPNSPGDNRVAIAISKLQHEEFVGNGNKTLSEDYLEGVGVLALAANKARINEEQTEGILAQAQAIKERISGVSLDEESANMVRYQQAYEAAARVIRVADEMFKTVLSLKS